MVPNISSPRSAVLRALSAVVEQPRDLRAGEIGVEEQAGPLAEHRLLTGGTQLLAEAGGTPVLPDDGVGDGTAVAVPDDRRLTLVRDADGGDVRGCCAGSLRALPGRSPVAIPRFRSRSCSTHPGCG